jgi:hypothetical protein
MLIDRSTAVTACAMIVDGKRLPQDVKTRWNNVKRRRLTQPTDDANACVTLLTGRVPRQIAPVIFPSDGLSFSISVVTQVIHILPQMWGELNDSNPYSPYAKGGWPMTTDFAKSILNYLIRSNVKNKEVYDQIVQHSIDGIKLSSFYERLGKKNGGQGTSFASNVALVITWFVYTYFAPQATEALFARVPPWAATFLMSSSVNIVATIVIQTIGFVAVSTLKKLEISWLFKGEAAFFPTLSRALWSLGTRQCLTEIRALLVLMKVDVKAQVSKLMSSLGWALADRQVLRGWIVKSLRASVASLPHGTYFLARMVIVIIDANFQIPIRRSRAEGYLFIRNHPLRELAMRKSTKVPGTRTNQEFYRLGWQ